MIASSSAVDVSLQAIVSELHGRKAGKGYVLRCPAHDDDRPSLSLAVRDGKLLVKCHAGCSQKALIVKLRSLGLWPVNGDNREPARLGALIDTYDYTDEGGKLLYQVCRFEPKDFKVRRPDGEGGWIWGYGNVRRVLYHLPELLEAPIVFVGEGEKDVEALRERGFVATTNPHGAEGWRDEFNEYFSRREVIVIPDNDPPGRRRAIQIVRGVLPYAALAAISRNHQR